MHIRFLQLLGKMLVCCVYNYFTTQRNIVPRAKYFSLRVIHRIFLNLRFIPFEKLLLGFIALELSFVYCMNNNPLYIFCRADQMSVNESPDRIEYGSLVLRTTYRNLNLNSRPFDYTARCSSDRRESPRHTFYQRRK